MSKAYFKEAAARFVDANARALGWMLDRQPIRGVWLNTKLDPVALKDRAPNDPWRGEGATYGWIQGRGLEALVRHAWFFRARDPALSGRLLDAARPLAFRLEALLAAHGGRAAFIYDAQDRPVRPDDKGRPLPQALSPGIATYSDIFVRKGLIAAAKAFAPERLHEQVAAFLSLVDDVENARFQMDEKARIGATPLAEDALHYGPRMILMGAGGLLREVGAADEARALASRLAQYVLDRHVGPSGLAADRIGGDACNPGHAIEFVGFACEAYADDMDDATAQRLERMLDASFALGFSGAGIRLSLSIATRAPLQPQMPWWSLPEAIRSAALIHRRTGSKRALEILRAADAAFFSHYWRGDPPVAYQMRDNAGPLDVAPATPDLDPGYHTGLSLLSAADALIALSGAHRP
jgi:hypothetical protein